MMRQFAICGLITLLLVTVRAESSAQLPDPSARSAAFAGAHTARARGYEAVFWNPANLALPDRPRWSLGLPAAHGFLANNSLGYGTIQGLYGEFLDEGTKSELLADIRGDDPERMFEMSADVAAYGLGLSFGRFAFGFGTTGAGTARISPDIVELLLFGNVGEDGTRDEFRFDGSNGIAWWTTGFSISYGHPFTLPALDWLGMKFAVGATFHYTMLHGLVEVRDRGSFVLNEPLSAGVDARRINTTDSSAGNGWSFDVGGAATWGPWTVGLALRNLIGDLSWNADDTELALFTATADFDSTVSTQTTRSFTDLGPDDQDRVRQFLEDADFPTRIRLGAGYRVGPRLNLSADYEEVLGGELRTGWDRRLAVGAELAVLSFLPLRAGLGTSFQDFAFGGGFGLYAGPFHFDLSALRQGLQDGGDGLRLAASLSFWP